MMTDTQREAFEREYAKHDLGKDSYGDYNYLPTHDAFLDFCAGWKAAQAQKPRISESELDNLVETIAEEVAAFERGSRCTIGWHIKRAILAKFSQIKEGV